MEQKEAIRLRGNLSGGHIITKTMTIPQWLYAFRGICFLFDDLAEAAMALEQRRIPPASAIVLKKSPGKDVLPEKQRFSEAFERSGRKEDSILLAADEETVSGVDALCFYSENPKAEDLFWRIENGDVLDYQIPAGNFTLDLPDPGRTNRLLGGGQDDYALLDLERGVRIIQDRYSRMFLVAGRERGLMIDCGFGRGDLKKLQQDYVPGEWITALTHGHGDHAAGCVQFGQIYGRRMNLEYAGIGYQGQLTELEDGMVFELGGRRATVIGTPGHSADDVCFYIEPERILICGDSIATGPSYAMTKGASVSRWIASMERLLSENLPMTKVYCSHREGVLRPSAIREMHDSLVELKLGKMKCYGASVYGFGHSFWQTNGKYSYFTGAGTDAL